LGRLVGRVRLEMLARGFAPIPTPSFLADGSLRRMKRDRLVLPSDSRRWSRWPQLARYRSWLECLLGEALPEESLGLADLELRHEPAGLEDEEVDRWHADGSYLRSVLTLHGPATIYRDGRSERPVPSGHTLLMTAMDRARALRLHCTLHRRPGAGPERAVIVCSFEPRRRDGSATGGRRVPRRAHASRERRPLPESLEQPPGRPHGPDDSSSGA
jgi:hypothetical protein